MIRRRAIGLVLSCLMFLPLPASASDRETAATALIDSMISDLETFLATDTGDEAARTAEIDRVLTTYFDMDSITRFSAGQYWRAASTEQSQNMAACSARCCAAPLSAILTNCTASPTALAGQQPRATNSSLCRAPLPTPPARGRPSR